MIKVEIITPWIGSGTDNDANRPQVGDDYSLLRWEDVTGQPSANLPLDINMYIILCECEDSVLSEIESDGIYQVLWSETINEESI